MAGVKHTRLFADHLFKPENEVIWVRQCGNGGQRKEDVEADLVDMHLLSGLTKGRTSIFHIAINGRTDETMTPEMWDHSLASIEKEFNLDGQHRVQVYHEKDNRPHLHAFWSLVNVEQRKLIPVRYYKLRLQKVATQLEHDFGHELTRRTPDENTIEITDADRMRKARTGKSPKTRKQMISRLWNTTDTSDDFLQVLEQQGFEVVQGERCKYALIDQDGNIYNLTRQLPKLVKQKQVHKRLGHQYDELPTLEEAKQRQQERKKKPRQIQQEKVTKRINRLKKKSRGKKRGRER